VTFAWLLPAVLLLLLLLSPVPRAAAALLQAGIGCVAASCSRGALTTTTLLLLVVLDICEAVIILAAICQGAALGVCGVAETTSTASCDDDGLHTCWSTTSAVCAACAVERLAKAVAFASDDVSVTVDDAAIPAAAISGPSAPCASAIAASVVAGIAAQGTLLQLRNLEAV
jgi:hypothetical protein